MISFVRGKILFFIIRFLSDIDVRSVASLLVIWKEREIERKRETTNICRSLLVAIVSAATKQTQIIYSIVDRINVSSVTLCVFSFLPLGTSVRLLYCCYDDHAIYTYSLSFFFRFSRRRCRPRRLTTHIYNTLFPFTSTSSFSFSLFFLACYLKGETQFKIASHSSL